MHKGSKIKNLIYVLLLAAVSAGCLFCLGKQLHVSAVTYVGNCGEKAEWQLNSATGVLKIYGEGPITDYNTAEAYPWYAYGDYIEKLEIDSGITTIPSYAFYRAEKLEDVIIPKTVIEIGDFAFYGCASLKSAEFGKNSLLTIIGEGAFAYCRNLRIFEIPTRVTEIKKNAFLYCYKLPDLTLGYSVRTIGEKAFSCCSTLSKIRIINYDCDIYDDGDTFYNRIIIESFDISTANSFADKYLREFSEIKNMKYLNNKKVNLSSNSFDYNGKSKKPEVTIKGMKEGKDFTVDYTNNKAPGIATVTISAAGNSLGEISKQFKINPARPDNLRVSERKENSLKLTWDKVYKATGYMVYQLMDGQWKKLRTTKDTEYTVKKLEPAAVYSFKVRAYTEAGDEKCYGKYSERLDTATNPETPSVKALTNRGTQRLRISWTSVDNCDGYEIYISGKEAKGYKKVAETVGRYSCSTTLTGLKSNKKYYIKIKAYKAVDEIRIYSSDSDVVSKSPM